MTATLKGATVTDLRPYVQPTPDVPKERFPRSELAPEGCMTLDGLQDHGRFEVSYREVVYATRTLADGRDCPRKLYVLTPSTRDEAQQAAHKQGYPCVLYVQGSAWRTQNLFSHFSEHVRLAEEGFVVACVQYRESSLAPFPAQAQDVRSAFAYLRRHARAFGICPTQMALWGDSSGAHSALLAAYTGAFVADGKGDAFGPCDADGKGDALGPCDALPAFETLRAQGTVNRLAFLVEDEPLRLAAPDAAGEPFEPRCVVDWYGPVAIDQMNCVPSAQDHDGPDSPEGCLIGGRRVREHRTWAAAASPLSYIPPAAERRLPPTLIMHGDRDPLVNFEQSVLLYEALRAAGQDVTFYRLPDAHHGCNGFRNDTALQVVWDFLRAHLCA